MFIAVKDKKVIAIHEVEWQCRRNAKGIDKPSYWTWLKSVTTVTGTSPDERKTYDFSGEDYEIHEFDLDIVGLTASDHIVSNLDGTHYHLKWDASKKEVVKDDTAKAAWELAEEWKRISAERTRLLAETDYLALKDNTLSTAMKEYRDKLRSIPQDNSDPYNITWPTKPS